MLFDSIGRLPLQGSLLRFLSAERRHFSLIIVGFAVRTSFAIEDRGEIAVKLAYL
jgi:hypothetical protein